MAFSSHSSGISPKLNVTPLIDIVLVLLIVFLVWTPQAIHHSSLQTPAASHTSHLSPIPPLILSISASGEVWIQDQLYERNTWLEHLQKNLPLQPDQGIFVKVDQNANYGEVLHILDQCRGVGAKTIQFSHE